MVRVTARHLFGIAAIILCLVLMVLTLSSKRGVAQLSDTRTSGAQPAEPGGTEHGEIGLSPDDVAHLLQDLEQMELALLTAHSFALGNIEGETADSFDLTEMERKLIFVLVRLQGALSRTRPKVANLLAQRDPQGAAADYCHDAISTSRSLKEAEAYAARVFSLVPSDSKTPDWRVKAGIALSRAYVENGRPKDGIAPFADAFWTRWRALADGDAAPSLGEWPGPGDWPAGLRVNEWAHVDRGYQELIEAGVAEDAIWLSVDAQRPATIDASSEMVDQARQRLRKRLSRWTPTEEWADIHYSYGNCHPEAIEFRERIMAPGTSIPGKRNPFVYGQ